MRDLGTFLMLIGGLLAASAVGWGLGMFLFWLAEQHLSKLQTAGLLGLGAAFFLICGFGCVVASGER